MPPLEFPKKIATLCGIAQVAHAVSSSGIFNSNMINVQKLNIVVLCSLLVKQYLILETRLGHLFI